MEFQPTSMFVIYNDIIKSNFEDIKGFLEEAEDNLKSKQKESETNYNEWTSSNEERNEEEYNWEFALHDELHKYHRIFPVYTFNPILLTIYGCFEAWLKKLCMLHHKRGFSRITVDDLAGSNYIEKSRKYIELVAGLSFKAKDKEWLRITSLQQIRNCIAHHSSNIFVKPGKKLKEQPLYQQIKEIPEIYLEESSGDFFIERKSFLLDTIHLLTEYLLKVSKSLDNLKVVARTASLPHDITAWGQEKTHSLLDDIISLKKHKQIEIPRSMAWNLTKLYAFFTDGAWKPGHADLILNKGREGLAQLKQEYNGWDVDVGDQ